MLSSSLPYQVEAVVNLERLADGALLGAGAHGAGRHPVSFSGLDVDATDGAADALLPVVDVDSGQGVAGHSGVQEGIRDVEGRSLNRRHLKFVFQKTWQLLILKAENGLN